MIRLFMASVCTFVVIACSTKDLAEQPLLNDDLKGWQQLGEARWNILNGTLTTVTPADTGYLVSDNRYKDFELRLEFMPDANVNSGIFIRCREQTTINADHCLELNIWDLHPKQVYRTGALVKLTKPLAHVDTLGKWNTYRILAKGQHIKAWVNGVLVTDHKVTTGERPAEGYIALQKLNQGQIQFRNLYLK